MWFDLMFICFAFVLGMGMGAIVIQMDRDSEHKEGAEENDENV